MKPCCYRKNKFFLLFSSTSNLLATWLFSPSCLYFCHVLISIWRGRDTRPCVAAWSQPAGSKTNLNQSLSRLRHHFCKDQFLFLLRKLFPEFCFQLLTYNYKGLGGLNLFIFIMYCLCIFREWQFVLNGSCEFTTWFFLTLWVWENEDKSLS